MHDTKLEQIEHEVWSAQSHIERLIDFDVDYDKLSPVLNAIRTLMSLILEEYSINETEIQ